MQISRVSFPILLLVMLSLCVSRANAFVPENPPVLTVDATPGQFTVTVSGTVEDADGDPVQVTITSVGVGPAIEIPVIVVDGRFSVDVPISFGQEALVVTATDVNGQTDSEIIDLDH